MTADTPDTRPNLLHLGRPAGAGCGCGGECMCGGHGYEERSVVRIRTEDAARAQAAMQEDAQ